MDRIRFSPIKDFLIKQKYGVSFEDVLSGELVDEIEHPKRTNQKILIFEYKNYLWSIPFVVEHKGIFLKTLYPSRKLMKRYKRGKNDKEI